MPRMSRPLRRPHPTSRQPGSKRRQTRTKKIPSPTETDAAAPPTPPQLPASPYIPPKNGTAGFDTPHSQATPLAHPSDTRTHNPMDARTMVSLESAPKQRRPLPSRRDTATILSDVCSPLWITAPPTAHRRRCWTHLDHLDRFLPKKRRDAVGKIFSTLH